jgi:DNA polymerase III subunit gamma/tau
MSVFYLKYRPAKLSELDLVEVGEKLKNFIEAKEMPQSFLFSGPKGAGKTSAARILAKTINCGNRKNGEACGSCDNCEEIGKNKAIDIIEMDAASNRGIEDIRNLKEKAYLLPSKLKYKVFIIDEVHMLTKDAFNALLKLIEEPPKHTIFILCTTDAEKIPETVLSRLVRVDFRKGEKDDLRRSLQKIIKGEKIKIDEKTIDFVVDKSDGSFRNLQKDFNELVLTIGENLLFEEVEKFYVGKSGNYMPIDFEKDLLRGEVKVILEKIEKMAADGIDFVLFRGSLLNYFQKKLLACFDIGKEKCEMSLNDLENWISLLIRASKQEKETEIDQLPLELAVVDFLKDFKKVSTKEIEEIEENKPDFIENSDETKDEVVTIDVTGLSLNKVEEAWGNVLMAVKPFNHSVEAFLRAARPIKLEGRNLTLEVFYPFHKDRLEEVKNREIVEQGILKVLGVELIFDCVLAKNKKKPLIIKNDTPVESVSESLVEKKDKKDLYDVAKDIFG